MASTLVTDYVGRGLSTARPTTPPIGSGATAFYFATDTGVLDFWNGSAWEAVGTATGPNSWSGAQRLTPVALTDAATIAVDLSLANNFTVTLGGNRTLGNPTNQVAGQAGQIVVTQDGTGSRTLSYASRWKFPAGTAPVLSTAAGAVDVLSYYVWDSTHVAVLGVLNLS
jgi:hypothetical protein